MVLLVATPPISGVPGTHSPPVTSMCAKTQMFLFKCLSCLLTAYQCILTHKKSHKRADICVWECQSVMPLSRMFGHSLVNIVIYEWPMVICRSKHTMLYTVIFNQAQSPFCQKQTAFPQTFCPFWMFWFVLCTLVSFSLKPNIVFSPLWRRPGPICVIAENILTDEFFERKFNGPQSYQSVWLWT